MCILQLSNVEIQDYLNIASRSMSQKLAIAQSFNYTSAQSATNAGGSAKEKNVMHSHSLAVPDQL
jgi:hypothetical protein